MNPLPDEVNVLKQEEGVSLHPEGNSAIQTEHEDTGQQPVEEEQKLNEQEVQEDVSAHQGKCVHPHF